MKRFIVNILLLIIIVCIVQTIIAYKYPYAPPESVTEFTRYQKNGINIIYFGDSTVRWHSQTDKITLTTAQMLIQIFEKSNHIVGPIVHDAYDAYAFDMYTTYMVEKHYYPDYIIIPINLRSFSPSWDLHPNFQFPEEGAYLNIYRIPILNTFMSFIINMYTPDVKRLYQTLYSLSTQYDGNTIVGNGASYENRIRESNPNSIRHPAMMQMYYMGTLKTDNRQLKALTHIADRYKNTKTKLIYYITPIDYQTGISLFGPRFSKQVKQNIGVLLSHFNKYQVTVLDLSFAQPTKNFTWPEVWYINEHLNQTGRLFIAGKLADIIDPLREDRELQSAQ